MDAESTGSVDAATSAPGWASPGHHFSAALEAQPWHERRPKVVIAAEVMTAAPVFGHLEPMLNAAQRELEAAGVSETFGVLLADAGYWHQRQMERIVDRGIPPDASKRRGARPGWDGGVYAFMRRVLATEHGGGFYRQRQPMIEPVFGQPSTTAGSIASTEEAAPPSERSGA